MQHVSGRPSQKLGVVASLFAAAVVGAACSGWIEEPGDEGPATGSGATGGGVGGGSGGGAAIDAGSTPDASEPAGEDDAEIVSSSFPTAMPCAQASTAVVEVKNTGSTTWTASGGYKLGAVGDSDPLSPETRITLPDGVVVLPGEQWKFEIALQAPAQQGSHVTDWQMVRENVAWFGQSAAPVVSVSCASLPPVPDKFEVVKLVASQYGHLLEKNTWESCGQFVQQVIAALADADWGHVGKTAGEGQYSPPGFGQMVEGHWLTGFSHDVIWHKPSNTQVDIIVNAAANSDANPAIWGPAKIGWEEIDPKHYRENNPWIPAQPIAP